MHRISIFTSLLAAALALGCGTSDSSSLAAGVDFTTFEWTEINADAPWAARAGLRVVELGGRFYLMGGRTPYVVGGQDFGIVSNFYNDVWRYALPTSQ